MSFISPPERSFPTHNPPPRDLRLISANINEASDFSKSIPEHSAFDPV